MELDIGIREKLTVEEISLWNDFIISQGGATEKGYSIGHNPSLCSYLSSFFNATPNFIFIKNRGDIIGLIQGCRKNSSFYSLPVFSTSGLIASPEVSRKEIYTALNKILGDFEIRDFISFSDYVYDTKQTFYLPLQKTVQDQTAFYKSKLRSQINKSYSNTLEIFTGGNDLLNGFFHIYSRNMHRLGIPVLGKSFFSGIMDNYQFGNSIVFVVRYNGKDIGASIVLDYGEFSEVGWASTVREFNHLGTNMFLYNEMISSAIGKGMKTFSFGRCTEDSSTCIFKKQWQGEFHKIYYNHSASFNRLEKSYKAVRKIYSLIPYPIVSKVSSIMRKRMISYT